jgi:hypothetical protein
MDMGDDGLSKIEALLAQVLKMQPEERYELGFERWRVVTRSSILRHCIHVVWGLQQRGDWPGEVKAKLKRGGRQ